METNNWGTEMLTGDWAGIAHQLLNTGLDYLREASSEDERGLRVQRIHTILDHIFRWYLYVEHGEQGAIHSEKTSFPRLVNLLHEKEMIDEELAQDLSRLNRLRTNVAHELYIPTHDDVIWFADCTSAVLEQLIPKQSLPASPKRSVMSVLSLWAVSIAPITFAVLYWIFPDLLPFNPVDDIVVGCSGMMVSGVLAFISLVKTIRYLRERR